MVDKVQKDKIVLVLSCGFEQGCTNPRCLVALAARFCVVAPNTLSSIIAALFFFLHKKMCIGTHALSRKHQRVV
jgi:hypothetical protein